MGHNFLIIDYDLGKKLNQKYNKEGEYWPDDHSGVLREHSDLSNAIEAVKGFRSGYPTRKKALVKAKEVYDLAVKNLEKKGGNKKITTALKKAIAAKK